ncbi:C40 family peptidase [Clostridium sp. HCP1S3_B4]|uniref:C40 family peptidase n=1 Tax=unclassified Clostridium TaxID=2614128 RepID=UPI003F8BEFAA
MKLKKLLVLLTITIFSFSILTPTQGASATEITKLLNMAFSFLGVPYEWGGNGPNSFDCSGFTSYVYKNSLGADIGRTTYDQINSGSDVTNSELQPGDLILPSTGHVQLYIGNNKVIHAPQTGEVVKVADVWNIYSARRIISSSPMESVIFDYKYYADTYPDLKVLYGYDYGSLYGHYITCGIREGRKPSKIFNPVYYLNVNEDLKNSFGNNYEAAYDHFATCGYKENRNASEEFNITDYRNDHPEMDSMDNLNIYKMIIRSTSSIEGIIFDYKYYADTYPDLKDTYGYDYEKLYNHYITCGIKEGRSPSKIFDPIYYLNTNADVKAYYGNDYEAAYKHFISEGYKENRPSSENCNIREFKEANSDKLIGKDDLYAYEMYKESLNVKKYTVKFYDLYGNEISEIQNVIEGERVIAPNVPELEGYDFVKWDKDFNSITSNLNVYAMYKKKQYKPATVTPGTTTPGTDTPATSSPSTELPEKEPELFKFNGADDTNSNSGNVNNGNNSEDNKNNNNIGNSGSNENLGNREDNTSNGSNNENKPSHNENPSDTYDYNNVIAITLLMFGSAIVFMRKRKLN